jgi:hypothetical protein
MNEDYGVEDGERHDGLLDERVDCENGDGAGGCVSASLLGSARRPRIRRQV